MKTAKKKNCENCVHLSYEHGDTNDPEGFTCLKRLTGGESTKYESDLLEKLTIKSFRMKAKRCCETKINQSAIRRSNAI